MPAAQNEAMMRELLDRWRGSGLFTHAFVASGHLAEAAPRLSVALLPDGRDVFDLASLTKALVTTPAVLRLVEDRRWFLDEPLARAPVVLKNPGWFAGIP